MVQTQCIYYGQLSQGRDWMDHGEERLEREDEEKSEKTADVWMQHI
jgi:hypothetical protein